jgi:hypothetical protein
MRLLHRLPNAVLWLIDDNEASTANLRTRAEEAGVDVSRLHFSPRTTHSEFCGRLKLADVFLDTYPYNCGSTSNDVLNAKVPLITIFGKTLVSKMGLSLLFSENSTVIIAKNYSDYEHNVLRIFNNKIINDRGSEVFEFRSQNVGVAIKKMCAQILENSKVKIFNKKTSSNLKIFQICYNENNLYELPKGFNILNNISNQRPDWREFWPIRNFLINNELEDGVFYGFLSPRFAEKTSLNYEKIKDFAAEYGLLNDVLIYSPFYDLNSFFVNSFHQGDFFHPGLLGCMQNFINTTNYELNLSEIVTHGDNTAFCNYFIAKKEFWLEWLRLGNDLFNAAEAGSGPLSGALNQNTIYNRGCLPQKIFIQERLVNVILANNRFKSKSWDMFNLPFSMTPLNKYREMAIRSNALKVAYAKSKNNVYLK